MSPIAWFVVVHAAGLVCSVLLGGVVAGRVLRRLKLGNADVEPRGASGAGAWIGYTERFLIYLAVGGGTPELLAVLVALKTVVRYPEIRHGIEHDEPGRFAEYYLVGTMVSVAVGVCFPLLAIGAISLID